MEKRIASLVGLLLFSLAASAAAAPATQLLISNNPCLINPCPLLPPPPTTVASGASIGVFVLAVDSQASIPTSYTGTVTFASSDPLASLPQSYTFVPADGNAKAFTAVLRTAGSQTITVSDPGNNLIPGTLVMLVTGGQSADSIPTISPGVQVLLALTLAFSGLWLLRLRS